jgi:hypothetical protein
MRDVTKLLVVAVVGLTAACARALPPPGGQRDVTPPRLLETTPGPLAVVPGFRGPATFHFDERISERGFSPALVLVSPLDGALRVERGRREVRVSIDGGWRPDRVYRIVLLPGVRDLFGNARTEQAEIVFSTGPDIPATAVGGIVVDRLTARPPQTPVVQAIRQGDSLTYTAIGDTAGFFSLRHLPLGVYDLFAFADLNRNRRHDAVEPFDVGEVTLSTPADTIAVTFDVLAPDTTPPRVTRAEVVDSLRVRITLDDYIDVDAPIQGAGAEVHVLPDSVAFAWGARLVQGPLFERERRRAAEAAATARADTLARERADTVVAAPPQQPPTGRAAAPQREPPLLPTRDIVVELNRPLEPGRDYTITLGGIANLHGLTGGGVARFSAPRAAPPVEEPAEPPPDALPPP